ncbi:MAG: dihydropteroate synthase [Verrucomicrobiales bacterium]|jgi:dihydropteroate synthase
MPAESYEYALHCRGRVIRFPRRPLIMGIININDDSFSGDGTLNVEDALETATTMVAQGADIIDVGAESARTNRAAISVKEEVNRLRPFVEAFSDAIASSDSTIDAAQLSPPLLSINTWRPEVAREILSSGGDILNDMGGLPDDSNAQICAEIGAALLIMHSVGEPKVPHLEVHWENPMQALCQFFKEKLALAENAGLAKAQTILDPGIDFAKQRDANLRIYAELDELAQFQRPVLVPVSRKTVIGEVLGIENPLQRDAGTIACLAAAQVRSAAIFRVHNVPAAAQAAKILEEITSRITSNYSQPITN